MIANLLKDRCACMPKPFQKAFDFLETLNPDTADGKYEIDGKNMYASVFSYTTLGRTPERMELHRKYIDIQYIIQGCEVLAWAPLQDLEILTPYDAEQDVEFAKTPRFFSLLEMRAGTYAVFMPQDAHWGKLASAADGAMFIRKAVVKVALDIL